MKRAVMTKKMIPYKPKLCFCVKFTKEERIYSRNQNGFTCAEMRGGIYADDAIVGGFAGLILLSGCDAAAGKSQKRSVLQLKLWHHLTEGEVLAELSADPNSGLTEQEAQQRLQQYGPNQLQGAKKESLLKRFLNQMRDPMIVVLLVAAALSLISSGFTDWADPLIMFS